MASSEPAYLPLGTEVSAKYRGAFCEAKVKVIAKNVKCKVTLKEGQATLMVTDEHIHGPLKVGAAVEVKHPESNKLMEATITKTNDCSMYTVVFDDGDERTLRRTQLCLKGEKHFIESETLDNLPLSHPEHFGTPVISAKGKRNRSSHGTGIEEDSEESSSDEASPRRKVYRGRNQDLVGKVMLFETGDKRKSHQIPVLVTLPDAHPMELKNKDHLLVRSFKDGKFMSAGRRDLNSFSREVALKNEEKHLKAAIEKALLFIDNKELPPSWQYKELLGSDDEDESDEEESSDEEQSEEKDRFVAQLYKFCDDRGTPINKGPTVGSKDLNLYRLFKIVQNLGGYNRVTSQMKWRLVYSKMLLPQSNTASTQIKNAYKKYLHAFEDFYRKLGSTMGTISRPGRSRNNSGRSIVPFRGREKDSPRSEKEEGKEIELEKDSIKVAEVKALASAKSDKAPDTEAEAAKPAEKAAQKPVEKGTPKRPKSARIKLDMKDVKDVKVEKEKEETKEKAETKKEDVREKRETKKEDPPSKKAGKKKEEEKKEPVEPKKVQKKSKDAESPVKVVKKEQEEEKEGKESKDSFKKNVGRRRSLRNEEVKKEGEGESEESAKPEKPEKKERKKAEKMETDDKKDQKEEKLKKKDEKEDKKEKLDDKKKEEKKDEKKDEKEDKKKREVTKKTRTDTSEAKREESESASGHVETNNNKDVPVGSKLRVRYGRGRNQKEYEAKVVELGSDSGHIQYLVHYAGWNTRYDEWIRPERIVRVVDRPDKKKTFKPSPKPTPKVNKKLADKPPSSPSNSTGSRSGSVEVGRPAKSKSPVSTAVTPKPRPTRSNSVEFPVMEGLPRKFPAKRRSRKTSGVYDSTKGSDSEDSDQSDDGKTVEDKEEERKDRGKNAMPAIPVAVKNHEEDMEIEEGADRSPPQLSKVTDLVRDKMETDEDPDGKKEEKMSKMEVKDEPAAPVLRVMEKKAVEEPVLEVVENPVVASTPPRIVRVELKEAKEVKKKEVEKKKDVDKKKEVERKGKKEPQFKWEGGEGSPKKAEKSKEITVAIEEKKCPLPGDEESPYDFKDDPELETDFKPRRKAVTVMEEVSKESGQEESVDDVTEVITVFSVKKVDVEDSVPAADSKAEEKAKSDSEIEKIGKLKGKKKEAKKPKVVPVEKKVIPVPSPEKKGAPCQSERRMGPITLAEKKAYFTPIDRTITFPQAESPGTLQEDKKDAEDKGIVAEVPTEGSDSDDKKGMDSLSSGVSKAEISSSVTEAVPQVTEVATKPGVESSDEANRGVTNEEELKSDKTKEGLETDKKKVKKKTKKKAATEGVSEGTTVQQVQKREVKIVRAKEKTGKAKDCMIRRKEPSVSEPVDSAPVGKEENKMDEVDIDLRCEERIKSRSVSPEIVSEKKVSVTESQGFEPLLEAMECQLKAGVAFASVPLQDQKVQHVKNDLFENTPPTTPEHESDSGGSQNEKQCDSVKNSATGVSEGGSSKMDTSCQGAGSESPTGNTSPSSNRSTGSSGIVASSEGSIDVPVHTSSAKRRRESDESTPSKRRKRASRGKSAAERQRERHLESDSEEASNLSGKCSSPQYIPDSYSSRSHHHSASRNNKSPRPSKYNFNLEEGKYLEGEARIAFLVDKIQDIRKIYMNLKSEVACIDRRRKRARRREKESASSSTVEVECS